MAQRKTRKRAFVHRALRNPWLAFAVAIATVVGTVVSLASWFGSFGQYFDPTDVRADSDLQQYSTESAHTRVRYLLVGNRDAMKDIVEGNVQSALPHLFAEPPYLLRTPPLDNAKRVLALDSLGCVIFESDTYAPDVVKAKFDSDPDYYLVRYQEGESQYNAAIGCVHAENVATLAGQYPEWPSLWPALLRANPAVRDLCLETVDVMACLDDCTTYLEVRLVKLMLLDLENISSKAVRVGKISGQVSETAWNVVVPWERKRLPTKGVAYTFGPEWLQPGEHIVIPLAVVLSVGNLPSFEALKTGAVLSAGQIYEGIGPHLEPAGRVRPAVVHKEYLLGPSLEVQAIAGLGEVRRFDPGSVVTVAREEVGSCPYVFLDADGLRRSMGTILTNCIGENRESMHRLTLPALSGALVTIAEMEDEVTLLDYLGLEISSDAKTVVCAAMQDEVLSQIDGNYKRLRRGDTLAFYLPHIDASAELTMVSSGYYQPVASVRRRPRSTDTIRR